MLFFFQTFFFLSVFCFRSIPAPVCSSLASTVCSSTPFNAIERTYAPCQILASCARAHHPCTLPMLTVRSSAPSNAIERTYNSMPKSSSCNLWIPTLQSCIFWLFVSFYFYFFLIFIFIFVNLVHMGRHSNTLWIMFILLYSLSPC